MMNSKGSTLIIGLLILSAVISTSILIGGIVFRELKLSFSAPDAMNAYYAAESGSEMALFEWLKWGNIKFEEGDLGDVKSSWNIRYQSLAADLTGNLGQHQTKEIPVYDVEADLPLSTLSHAEVLWSGGGLMEYSLFGWNEDEPIKFFTKGGEIGRGVMNSNSCISGGGYACKIVFNNLDPAKKYIVRFRPMCDPESAGICSNSWDYKFNAYDRFGFLLNLPIGFQVDSTGYQAREYQRSVEVAIPIRGETFGIFDYGLFSDQQLKLK